MNHSHDNAVRTSKRKKKNLKILWYVFLLAAIGLVISLFVLEEREKELLDDNYTVTNAELLDFSSNMGAFYVDYVYQVDGQEYYDSDRLGRDQVDLSLIGIKDLQVKYSNEDISVSETCDTRLQWL